MRILVDVDGVLADLVGALCARIDGGYTPDDVKSYDLSETFNPKSMAQAVGAMSDPGFALSLSHYSGACEFVEALRERAGDEVIAVTKPFDKSPTWAYERTRWLWNRGIERVVHTGEKHLIRGDVLIEDDPRNVSGWLRANDLGFAILMDRPWNRDAFHAAEAGLTHAHMMGRVKRATSFDHALAILEDK